MKGFTDRGVRGLSLRDKPIKTAGASWLEPTGAAVFFDDFLGDTLDTNRWLATETATGVVWAISATAGDPKAGHGGWASAQSDNVDAAAEELGAAASATTGLFKAERAGNGLLVFQASIDSPTALTARLINCGLTDDPTEGAALAMTLATTTWTTTATDAALWGLYSTATDNTHWLGQSVDTDVDDTHVVGGTATFNTATCLRIEIDSAGNVYWYGDDDIHTNPTYRGTGVTGVSPDVLLGPYVAIGSTTTTAADIECDYVLVACAR